MAISVIGVAQGQGGSASFSVALPGGLQQYDVVYAMESFGIAFSFPGISTSGYVVIRDDAVVGFCRLYRKVMGVTPDTSIEVNGGTSGYGHTLIAMVLRGVNQTTPEDAAIPGLTGNTTLAPDSPAVTTVTPNALVATIAAKLVLDSVFVPTGYSNHTVAQSGSTVRITAALASRVVATPGIENPPTWGSFGAGTNASATMFTLAVREQPVARTMVAASGSYAMTGNYAYVGSGKFIVAYPGAHYLTGKYVYLDAEEYYGHVTGGGITPWGSSPWGGTQAPALASFSLSAEHGVYNLTGQTAALNVQTAGAKQLVASPGVYNLVGQDAALQVARIFRVDHGIYVTDGQQAVFKRNRQITADKGTYIISGKDATFNYAVPGIERSRGYIVGV